ncbi:MAG: hypothetical protein J6C64_00305 [Lachnospiraceae bacterium]|nr:hypothetical protein [Lachnospiraceae bacterium]
MKKVDILYNIFDSSSSILIDGKEISQYSSLIKYTMQPFEVWYDKICDAVFNEIEDFFCLCFTADSIRIAVLKDLAGKCRWCSSFHEGKYSNDLSIQLRMQKLNLLLKNRRANYECRTYLLTFDADSAREKNMLKTLDIKNRFCSIVMQECDVKPRIYISDSTDRIKKKQAKYCFCISEETKTEVRDNSIIFFVRKEKLLDALFRCILSDVCLQALIENAKICFSNGIISENEKKELLAIEKEVEVRCDTQIELHRSKNIEFWQNGEKVSCSLFSFSYDKPGIIKCNGLTVEGLNEGKADLYIHYAGRNEIFKKIEFKVKKYNYVSQITIIETAVVMGIGDKKRINVTVFPDNADNLHEEKWKSENENIVACHKREIAARSVGRAKVWCCIGNVSASLLVEVKEYLKDINVVNSQLEMYPGEEKALEYTLVPNDALDKNIKISSKNIMVCNVIGNRLQAKEVGQTEVILESQLTSLKQVIEVKVAKRKIKLFRRK